MRLSLLHFALTSVELSSLNSFTIPAGVSNISVCADTIFWNTVYQLLTYCDQVGGLYVNGELDSVTNGGFQKIVIHLKTDLHVEFNTLGIKVQEGQTVTHHTGQDLFTAGSATIIRRNNEIDVAADDIRIVILIHTKDGKEFYWPVLRQRSSADDIEGILALKPAVYEEVQQNSVTKVKIEDQEFYATSSTAFDYSVASPVSMHCWLVSADAALQRSLNDFLVANL